jgi:hypothetical protein
MLRILKSLPLVLAVSCAGPRVPTAFTPGSAASPATPAPPRPTVATVLLQGNPLEAPACADQHGRPAQCPVAQGGHEHGEHGQQLGHKEPADAGQPHDKDAEADTRSAKPAQHHHHH